MLAPIMLEIFCSFCYAHGSKNQKESVEPQFRANSKIQLIIPGSSAFPYTDFMKSIHNFCSSAVTQNEYHDAIETTPISFMKVPYWCRK